MSRKETTGGFTLIELLVAITIAGILLAIALPSFEGTILRNRLSTSTNQLIAGVSLARSEAIRSTQGASICPSADGASCGGEWDDGLLVWADRDNNDVVAASEAVRYIQLPTGLTLASAAASIDFNGRGTIVGGATPAFTLQPEEGQCPSSKELVTTLSMNASGQINTEKSACP